MKQQKHDLSRGAQGGGVPHGFVSSGRCAASPLTCAMGHPTTLLRRGQQAVGGLGAWVGAATQVKEETAQRSGDTEWTPPPMSRGFARSAPAPLFHGLRVARPVMEN